MLLKELKIGEKARILSLLRSEKVFSKRLIAMGLLPGTEIRLVRKAPLGDPIEIELRGYSLSLRKSEANLLQIELVS